MNFICNFTWTYNFFSVFNILEQNTRFAEMFSFQFDGFHGFQEGLNFELQSPSLQLEF